MPDDHARAERLRQEPRTDFSAAERMRRFVDALHIRLVREVARLDPAAAQVSAAPLPGDEGMAVEVAGGPLVADGLVAVRDVVDDKGREVALVLHLTPAPSDLPGVWFEVRYVARGADPFRPDRWWFDGRMTLTGTAVRDEDRRHLSDVGERLGRHHAGVVDGVDVRLVWGEGDAVLTLGPLSNDLEGAFLLVRDAARTLPVAYVGAVSRRLASASGRTEPVKTGR